MHLQRVEPQNFIRIRPQRFLPGDKHKPQIRAKIKKGLQGALQTFVFRSYNEYMWKVIEYQDRRGYRSNSCGELLK